VTSRNLGDPQRGLLDYYADIRTLPFESRQHLDCDLLLIQDERNQKQDEPGTSWALIWQGKRVADRRESFRLYRYTPNPP
jgi:hypothetical protein